MIDTFRKNQRISSYYTSVIHQAQTYVLPSKVLLRVNWEPLPDVAGPLISTELQVALLCTRQMKYWLQMQHTKVTEDPLPKIELFLKYRYYFYSCFQSWGDKKCVRYKHKADALWKSVLSTDRIICTDFFCVFCWVFLFGKMSVQHKRFGIKDQYIFRTKHITVCYCAEQHIS